jgi:hypothetical protein
VEAIHSPNASGAPNNLNFRIPGGLRATRTLVQPKVRGSYQRR